MTRLSFGIALSIALILTSHLAPSAQAATSLTQQVLIKFDGTLTGSVYNLAPGEIDTTGTFSANGQATVSGGMGDIPGDLDPTTEGSGNAEGVGAGTGSGFFFRGTFVGDGDLRDDSWVSETRFILDTPLQEQPGSQNPNLDPGLNGFAHIMGAFGDTFYRIAGLPGSKHTEYGYWDGGSEVINPSPNPVDGQINHAALVWDGVNTTLTAYLNGASQGTIDLNAYDVSSPNVGYGFFARFFNRAINGKLDAVAFSTFEGDFDAPKDFQLVFPEPNSILLSLLPALGVLSWRKR